MDDTGVRHLLRGALGGLIGAPLFLIGLALSDKFRLGYVPYGGALQVIALPYFLPIGAALGAVTGGIIWILATRAKIGVSPIIRAGVGASFIILLAGVIHLLSSSENSGLIPPTPTEALVNRLLFVTAFGVLPGLMARPKDLRVARG